MAGAVQVIYDQRPKLSDALGTLANTLRGQSMYRDQQSQAQRSAADAQDAAEEKQATLQAEARAKDYNAKIASFNLTPQQRAAVDKVFAGRDPEAAQFLSGSVEFTPTDEQTQKSSASTDLAYLAAEAAKRRRAASEGGAPPLATDFADSTGEKYVSGELPKTYLFNNVGGSPTPAGLPGGGVPAPPASTVSTQPPQATSPSSAPVTPPPNAASPTVNANGDPIAPTPMSDASDSNTGTRDQFLRYRVAPDEASADGGDGSTANTPGSALASTLRDTNVPAPTVTAGSMVGTGKPSDQNRGPGSVPTGFNPAQMAIARQTLGVDPNGNEQVTQAGNAQTRAETARKNRTDEARLASTAASENALHGAQAAEARQKVADAQNAAKQFSTATTGVPGTADLSGASPIIRAAIKREYDPALMRRWKPEQQAAFEAEVQKYDPNFSMAEYPKQLAVKRSFTSGQDANTVKSINQLVGHLDTLVSTYNQIDNTRVPAYNAVGNFLGGQLGNQRIQKAQGAIGQAVNAVANEAAKTFHGSGVPAEKEIEEFRRSIGPNTSPAEFQGATQTLMHLLGTAIDQMQTKYKQGVGVQEDFQIIQPKTATILKKLEGAPAPAAPTPAAPAPSAARTTTPQPTAVPGQPKIGDTRTYPNGNIGVWNGHGWVLHQ
jgi:uncharacterized cupin superfamily protein